MKILGGLMMLAAAARFGIPAFRNLRTSQRLAESGTQVEGRVVSVFRKVTRNSDSVVSRRTVTLIETIEFTTAEGRIVRGNPVLSDVGHTDRSGTSVVVYFDPAQPESFIAPLDELKVSPLRPVVLLLVAAIFVIWGLSWVFGMLG
ncbi:DUF3592 domain-containing protein [Brachybacterium sp. J144]|uniref:DUF3592 domain-containing protein n=1 Tax=Brachybacterium sp. J144 TaxID=3116487 RepID=UPI002E7750DE|nr:DUF3592 domain-containing protein [Brachybacterium sp. J144]MEE1650225.1 DUF3592 domain-containing protein [Brachybacterium sp. J144]